MFTCIYAWPRIGTSIIIRLNARFGWESLEKKPLLCNKLPVKELLNQRMKVHLVLEKDAQSKTQELEAAPSETAPPQQVRQTKLILRLKKVISPNHPDGSKHHLNTESPWWTWRRLQGCICYLSPSYHIFYICNI